MSTGDDWLDGKAEATATVPEVINGLAPFRAEQAEQDQPAPPAELPADVKVEAAGETQPEAEPTAPQVSVDIQAVVDDHTAALEEWHREVTELNNEAIRLRRIFDDLKEQTKDARKAWEVASNAVSDRIADAPKPMPLFDQKRSTRDPSPEAAATYAEMGLTLKSTIKTEPAPAAVESDAWRAVDIKEVGFHPGVEKSLRAGGIHTIGEFEDRRAAVYAKTGKWPKGIGKGKAEAAVELVLSWLSKHRDGIDNTGRKERLADELAERADVEGEETGNADYSWNEHTPEEKAAAIHRRATELNNGENECLAPPADDEGTGAHYDQGSNAYDAGEPITSCCYAPGKYQDAWLRGWMAAQLVDEHEGAVPVVDGEELGAEAGDLEFEGDGDEQFDEIDM